MGAPIVTIDRAVGSTQTAARAAGGTTRTKAASTPTFLSTESLTFPGVSLISLGLVQIYEKADGEPATTGTIGVMAGVLGLIVIIWGLLSPTNARGDWRNMIGQVLIGLLNTALLFGVMLGVGTGK